MVMSGGIQDLNVWIERKCGNVSPLHLFQFCFSCVVDGDVIFFSFALLFFIVHTDMNFLPPTDFFFCCSTGTSSGLLGLDQRTDRPSCVSLFYIQVWELF